MNNEICIYHSDYPADGCKVCSVSFHSNYNYLENTVFTGEDEEDEEDEEYVDDDEVGARTPLKIASSLGFTEVVKILLLYGANIDENPTGYGLHAIHLAAEEGHDDIIELLLSNGSNINARDDGGRTALYYATHYERYSTVELLLKAGAKVNIIGKSLLYGRKMETPFDINTDARLFDLLLKYRGKRYRELKAEGKA
jgi:hypothetical protein